MRGLSKTRGERWSLDVGRLVVSAPSIQGKRKQISAELETFSLSGIETSW
jgi:hypothetical protein